VNAGDDSSAIPGFGFWQNLFAMPSRHVERPRSVQAGVAKNASQKSAPIFSGGFEE
jgi:hypothetical protein